MKTKKCSKLIYLVLMILISISCSDNNIINPETDTEIKSIDGKILLSFANNDIDVSSLDISSYYEDDDITSEKTFDIDVASDIEDPQIIFAVNDKEEYVLAGYIEADDTELIINEVSTAKVMVLTNIIFLGLDADQKELVLDIIDECSTFPTLLSSLSKTINEDLQNVFNSDLHPELDELAAEVAVEAYLQLKPTGLLKGNSQKSVGTVAPDIDRKLGTNEVVFSNHNLVFLCGQATDMSDNEKENVFTVGRRKSLLKWHWLGVSEDVETNTGFKNSNTSYIIDLTKGFDKNILSFSETFSWSKPYGRACILNSTVALGEALKLLGLGAVVISADLLAPIIQEHKDEIIEHYNNFTKHLKNGDKLLAYSSMMTMFQSLVTQLVGGGVITLVKAKGIINKIKTFIKELLDKIPVIKGVLVAKQLAAETIPFITNVLFGDNYYRYYARISKDNTVRQAFYIKPGLPVPPFVSVDTGTDSDDLISKNPVFTINSMFYNTHQYKYYVTAKYGPDEPSCYFGNEIIDQKSSQLFGKGKKYTYTLPVSKTGFYNVKIRCESVEKKQSQLYDIIFLKDR